MDLPWLVYIQRRLFMFHYFPMIHTFKFTTITTTYILSKQVYTDFV